MGLVVRAEDHVTDDGPRSTAGGAVVLAVAGAGLGVAFYALSHDWFVIVVWAVGWAWMVKVARTPNPAPPPAPDPSPPEKPQLNIVQDPDDPKHWIVNPEDTP